MNTKNVLIVLAILAAIVILVTPVGSEVRDAISEFGSSLNIQGLTAQTAGSFSPGVGSGINGCPTSPAEAVSVFGGEEARWNQLEDPVVTSRLLPAWSLAEARSSDQNPTMSWLYLPAGMRADWWDNQTAWSSYGAGYFGRVSEATIWCDPIDGQTPPHPVQDVSETPQSVSTGAAFQRTDYTTVAIVSGQSTGGSSAGAGASAQHVPANIAVGDTVQATTGLKIRSGAGANFADVGRLTQNVVARAVTGEWVRFDCPAGITSPTGECWSSARYLRVVQGAVPPTPAPQQVNNPQPQQSQPQPAPPQSPVEPTQVTFSCPSFGGVQTYPIENNSGCKLDWDEGRGTVTDVVPAGWRVESDAGNFSAGQTATFGSGTFRPA